MTDRDQSVDPLEQSRDNVGRFTDEGTEKRIHQHLSDIADKISEQDISYVKTDFKEDNSGVTDDAGDADRGTKSGSDAEQAGKATGMTNRALHHLLRPGIF